MLKNSCMTSKSGHSLLLTEVAAVISSGLAQDQQKQVSVERKPGDHPHGAFLDNRFPGLRESILRGRQEKALRRSRMTEILNTVESVVDGTDSEIRLVPGYKKKLQSVICSALEFSDDLVNQIPPPIEVGSGTFTFEPYVNAFFTNVTDLRPVFAHSSELQDYIEDIRHADARCCALLCMCRSEITVKGWSGVPQG